jgi:hypothetical protein
MDRCRKCEVLSVFERAMLLEDISETPRLREERQPTFGHGALRDERRCDPRRRVNDAKDSGP